MSLHHHTWFLWCGDSEYDFRDASTLPTELHPPPRHIFLDTQNVNRWGGGMGLSFKRGIELMVQCRRWPRRKTEDCKAVQVPAKILGP